MLDKDWRRHYAAGGHPPACTCVACNEGSSHSRSTATVTSGDNGGRTRRRSNATSAYRNGNGGGCAKIILWGLLIVGAIITFSAFSGCTIDDIRRFLAPPEPTPPPIVVVITATPADTPTSTSTPISTLTPTSTSTPVLAVAPTNTATHTPAPTATLRPTFTPTATKTPLHTATGTSTSTPTTTPTITPTAFVCGYAEMVLIGAGKKHKFCHTPTPEGYIAPRHTNTPVPANTTTPIPLHTHTPVPTSTPTVQPFRVVVISVPTNTPTTVATPIPTNTPRVIVAPLHTNTPVPTLTPIPTIMSLPTLAPTPTISVNTSPLHVVITAVKPVIDIRQLEDLTHKLINSERVKRGLNSLEHVENIRLIARSHSEDMAVKDYFSHTSPVGLSPTDRGNEAGYDCRKDYGSYYTYGLAENIHQGWLYDSYRTLNGRIVSYEWFTLEGLAQTAVTGWMGSTGHRENILKSSYDRTGLGVAIAEDGKVYFTQNFC